MKLNIENIGDKIWVSGENSFVLYKTDNILRYYGMDLKHISLEPQEVTIIDTNKFMLKNGDIFLL